MEKPQTSTSYFQNLFKKGKIGNLVTQSIFGNYKRFYIRKCTEHNENEYVQRNIMLEVIRENFSNSKKVTEIFTYM
jgi:hypothetical protein